MNRKVLTQIGLGLLVSMAVFPAHAAEPVDMGGDLAIELIAAQKPRAASLTYTRVYQQYEEGKQGVIRLVGEFPAGQTVTLIKFSSGMVFTTKTGASRKIQDEELGRAVQFTELDKQPLLARDEYASDMLAIIGTLPAQPKVIVPQTIKQTPAQLARYKAEVAASADLKTLFALYGEDGNPSGKIDQPAVSKLKTLTPLVQSLGQANGPFLVSYVGSDEKMTEEEVFDSHLTTPKFISQGGKAYGITGPCGEVFGAYKIGTSTFVFSMSCACNSDACGYLLHEVTPTGAKKVAEFSDLLNGE